MDNSISTFPVLCRSNYRMQIFVNYIYLPTSILFSKAKVILKKSIYLSYFQCEAAQTKRDKSLEASFTSYKLLFHFYLKIIFKCCFQMIFNPFLLTLSKAYFFTEYIFIQRCITSTKRKLDINFVIRFNCDFHFM